MLDNNLTSQDIDRTYGNFPEREEDQNRESYTIGSSLGGKLGSRFKWEAFWQYGHVTDNVTEANSPWKSHWMAGSEGIADPVTGEPICRAAAARAQRSEEHTAELTLLMRNSYAVIRVKKKTREGR